VISPRWPPEYFPCRGGACPAKRDLAIKWLSTELRKPSKRRGALQRVPSVILSLGLTPPTASEKQLRLEGTTSVVP
jgi:hypothetical protein